MSSPFIAPKRSSWRMKIALECSKGGHLQEMMSLKDAWKDHDHFLITYDSERTRSLDHRRYLITHPIESVPRFLTSLFIALGRVFGERPDVLISTGMGWTDIFMFPFCRLMGTYTIYLESAANVDDITGTARFIRRFSDRFLVQWEELADRIGAEYHGGVL